MEHNLRNLYGQLLLSFEKQFVVHKGVVFVIGPAVSLGLNFKIDCK